MLRACYVDHGLRAEPEIAAEISLVSRVCAGIGVPLTIARIRRGAIGERAAATGRGIEACARDYRYHALKSVAARFSAGLVATGHNSDDQAETILMRFLCGTGLGGRGAAGMPSVRELAPRILLLRPVLSLSRNELSSYLEANGIPHCDDSSNSDQRFRRNDVRLRIGPAISESFPGWKRALLLGAQKSRLAAESIHREAEALMGRLSEPGTPMIELETFRRSTEAVRVETLSLAFRAAGLRPVPSFRELFAIQREMAAGNIPKIARRFVPMLDFPRVHGYFVRVAAPGIHVAPPLRIHAEWRIFPERTGTMPPGSASCGYALNKGSFAFPLVVRSRRPGDTILTEQGSVRVDDLLSSWRMDRRYRDIVPVIEDSRGIVGVVPAALAGSESLAGMRHARFRAGETPDADGGLWIRIEGVLVSDGQ